MPLFLFERPTPRPDESPASASPSRFSAIQNNVRSMLNFNGSSVYSDSPPPSQNNTPKLPFLGFLRREQSPPPIPILSAEEPRDSTSSHSPLRPQHTAGSYLGMLGSYPTAPDATYNRHPADVPLNHTRTGSVDPETEQLAEEVNQQRRRRRRRKHHRHRRHHSHHSYHSDGYWVRRKAERGSCFSFVKGQAARSKCMACLISGLFLMTVLTIYLSLALTRKSLHQEIHVLFIMIILGTTIFFCHSLIRLCMLALRPEPDTPRIPSMTGPDGFKPIRPIRVHLARDEELGLAEEAADTDDVEHSEEKTAVKQPPPAYGLWRSSVRVDPNLLHWQRADAVETPATTTNKHTSRISILPRPISSVVPPSPLGPSSRSGSASGPSPREQEQQQEQGPRPPSYVSEDGVDYVVSAQPRSVAPSEIGVGSSGMSDVHPAWRPGFAMSEVGGWAARANDRR